MIKDAQWSVLRSRLVSVLSTLCAILLFFGVGFYIGWKVKEANSTNSNTNLAQNNILTSQAAAQTEKSANIPKIESLPVEGVSFIKANNPKNCPETHQIKGTFTLDVGYFYTKENKSYDRVKPDICFASEEFAKDTAGFIKKF
jgi:hypothetical protein